MDRRTIGKVSETLEQEDWLFSNRAAEDRAPEDLLFSTRDDGKFMEDALLHNESSGFVSNATMKEAQSVREAVRAILTNPDLQDALGLPEDVKGNTFFPDASYGGTEENSLICPRSMGAEALVDAVSDLVGRPLTVDEQIVISQEMQGLTKNPECVYCYVATDRKAYREYLGDYIKQRNAVLEKFRSGQTDVSRSGELYQEFLGGRKDTKNMWDRFNMWIRAEKAGAQLLKASDLTNMNRLVAMQSEKFSSIKDSLMRQQYIDAMKYAQAASWAKKRVGYVAYNGHILNWKQNRINALNNHYGLRMYSFSDFSPAFILENMQMITDASVRGLKMLGYTKDLNFVRIFAKTGMNINVSCFGFESGGNVYENAFQGASWQQAQELRAENPNVGIVFVATSDHLVEWAMEQDWIDVVIPYHLVRTGTKVAEAFGFTNYTDISGDKKITGEWAKGQDIASIPPTMHNNNKGQYLAALEANHLKPRFEKWLDHPGYMKLVNETRRSAAETPSVQPVFDLGAAKSALNDMMREGGYYQPIGGSVDRMWEIAQGIAEKLEDHGDVTLYSPREVYADAVDDLLTIDNDKYMEEKSKAPFIQVMANTPKVVLDNVPWSKDRGILIRRDALYLALRESGIQEGHYHNLGAETMKKIPDYIGNPDVILNTDTSGRALLLSHIDSANGQGCVCQLETA